MRGGERMRGSWMRGGKRQGDSELKGEREQGGVFKGKERIRE